MTVGDTLAATAPSFSRRVRRRASSGQGLVCSGLTVRYRGRSEPTIRDVDVVLPDGGLIAVVGPSGSGKSTLCAAILGEIENVQGQVVLAGVDLLASPARARSLVSLVPQRDALHHELTARRALQLTAELRLAPQVRLEGRLRRVEEVLGLLEIADHGDRRIGQLSGGQRKRVAVAMELLSDPRLLLLDEPTSGLDEGLDLVMMQLLRRVADDGRSVLVVTHSTANLNLVDSVLALDVHGQVAYAGPPPELLDSFNVDTYAEAMQALRNAPAAGAAAWSRLGAAPADRDLPRADRTDPGGTDPAGTDPAGTDLAGTEVAGSDVDGPQPGRPDPDRTPGGALDLLAGLNARGWRGSAAGGAFRGAVAVDVVPHVHRFRSPRHARRSSAVAGPGEVGGGMSTAHATKVLLRRELERLFANPLTLARGTLLLPLLSCVLTAWAADRGLAWTAADPNRMQGAAMSVLITCITFFAMALSFSSVVGDREVIEREHRWGVPPVSVITSKALALLGPVVCQAVVTYACYAAVRPGPDRVVAGVPRWLGLGGSLAVLGIASMALGLLVSTSSRTLERAIFLLMGCIAVLVVLTGLLIPLGRPQGLGGHVLATIAQLAPTRWGTAAISAYIGYVPNEAMNPGGGNADALWIQDGRHVATALLSLLALAVVYTLSAAQLLTAQSRRRR